MFDAVTAAVEGALAAGARYADARGMLQRQESMSARNVRRRRPRAAGVRGRRRPGAGRLVLGLRGGARPVRPAGPRGRRRGGGRGAGVGERARPGRGPDPGRRPAGQLGEPVRGGPPLSVSADEKGDLVAGVTADHARRGRPGRRGVVRDLGHAEVVRPPARAPGSTSASASAAPASSATAIGAGETQRRSYPGIRGQYGTRGWELVRSLDLPGNRGAGRGGGAGAAHRAGLPGRRDRPDPRQRADGAADPRVRRARRRARPHPRLGGRVRRHVLAGPSPSWARCASARTS